MHRMCFCMNIIVCVYAYRCASVNMCKCVWRGWVEYRNGWPNAHMGHAKHNTWSCCWIWYAENARTCRDLSLLLWCCHCGLVLRDIRLAVLVYSESNMVYWHKLCAHSHKTEKWTFQRAFGRREGLVSMMWRLISLMHLYDIVICVHAGTVQYAIQCEHLSNSQQK